MRARLIGVGIVAIFVAMVLQIRADASLNANPGPEESVRATLSASQFSNTTQPAQGSVQFFVRPQGRKGELTAYDMAKSRPSFKLPRGLASADWSHYFSASTEPDATSIVTHDLSTGEFEFSFTLSGAWNLESVSPTGSLLGLSRLFTDREMIDLRKEKKWKTDIEIVEPTHGRVAHALSLDGNYDAQAITDGYLFLVENLPTTNPDHFVIRLYDLTTDELLPDPLVENGSGKVMAGEPLDQVVTPDGSMLLTLYLDAGRQVAFIQILDLINKSLAAIDLPSGDGNLADLKAYSLALSSTDMKAYAVNAKLGLITVLNAETRGVVRVERFNRSDYPAPLAFDPFAPRAASVVSDDGQKLFFDESNEIWALDTRKGKVTDSYELGTEIYGLGINHSGNRLYAATSADSARAFIVPINGTLVPLDAGSGP